MNKQIRYGIICPSNIAEKRFLPALQKSKTSKFIGMAHASLEEWKGSTQADIEKEKGKVESIVKKYGGKVFSSYRGLIESDEIDALYIPLPPSLHFSWAKLALENFKHVLLEKPSTNSVELTSKLTDIARKKKLALHENYMFAFHNQLESVNELMKTEKIGELRLIRLSFGFPKRSTGDFRYRKELGGGALLDCGGYNIKYASMLLGETAEIEQATLNYTDEFEVDMFGSAVLKNKKNQVAQIAFGMDNDYRCSIDVWGSNGSLFTNRIFTAPEGYRPTIEITVNGIKEVIELPSDDTFYKSIKAFEACIDDDDHRLLSYGEIEQQAKYVDDFIKLSNKEK